MLDVEKIRLMTELVRYENEQNREDLKVSRYYRSDYIGIALLKNLLIMSIGYVLLWGVIIAYNLDYLLDNLHKMDFAFVIFEFAVGYVIIVLLYSIITYIIKFSRYEKARKSVGGYYEKLGELMEIYGEPNLSVKLSKPTGRKSK